MNVCKKENWCKIYIFIIFFYCLFIYCILLFFLKYSNYCMIKNKCKCECYWNVNKLCNYCYFFFIFDIVYEKKF